MLTFDFEGNTFVDGNQALEVLFFRTTFDVDDPANFNCNANPFVVDSSDSYPMRTAVAVVSNDSLQATVTTSIAEIVGDDTIATTVSSGSSTTVEYCVQVTLCGNTSRLATNNDVCDTPIIDRSVVDIVFGFQTMDGRTAVLSSDPTAISVETETTLFSEEFAVEAILVAHPTDCSTSPTKNVVVEEAMTGNNYHICIYKNTVADASSDRAATSSIQDITGWQLTSSTGTQVADGDGELVSNCDAGATPADFCVTTNAFTLSELLVPDGPKARALIKGTVDATMIIDGRRRQGKLQFAVGSEGPLREPIRFVATRRTTKNPAADHPGKPVTS